MAGSFAELQETIDTLRGPGGCPWDRKQDLVSASRYLMDEAGELLDAALAGDHAHAREELGDLLFMVSFCCRILAEDHAVTMDDVAREGLSNLARGPTWIAGETNRVAAADHNVFWATHGKVSVKGGPAGGPLKNWKALFGEKYDRHSVVADPRFVNPARRDYRLRTDSPALKLGFKSIDTAKIGLKADFPTRLGPRPGRKR